jgi:hypothetical protein
MEKLFLCLYRHLRIDKKINNYSFKNFIFDALSLKRQHMIRYLVAFALLFSLFSCAKSKHKIGDMYKGGYIFKINMWGKGLCAAPTDKKGGLKWGCYGTLIDGADGEDVGDGEQNTKDIVDMCEEITAARYCDELEIDGYDDWYLPSIGELELMYNELHANGLGSFTTGNYWSSTENFSLGAWCFNFGTAERGNNQHKNTALTFRPIRSF